MYMRGFFRKTVILLIICIVSFISCKKEEDNLGDNEGLFLSQDEISYLPYEIGDSLVFGRYYHDGFTEDSVSYYITSKQKTESDVKYDFEGIDDYGGYFKVEKVKGNLNYHVNFYVNEYFSYDIEKISNEIPSFTMNEQIYNNVLLIEKDSSQNSVDPYSISRAYIAKEVGVIYIHKDNFIFKLVEHYRPSEETEPKNHRQIQLARKSSLNLR